MGGLIHGLKNLIGEIFISFRINFCPRS
uniref:Uncharacterized protein n=1 Tax=Arundo donax TaxID=35708 RepID=A0A0A9A2J3_ARUDO